MSEKPQLIPPYGGRLVELTVHSAERDELLRMAQGLPSLQLSPRSLCDLELHPVVGRTEPEDVDYFTCVRTYRVLVEGYWGFLLEEGQEMGVQAEDDQGRTSGI